MQGFRLHRRGNGSHIAHLKKVLALVMAFAMAFTMMAGAAYTDSADIEATEAVDTLSALGVINGYEDGSFKPNGTVTRAEMAAMIYIVRNGGKTDASGYENLPTSFTDIKGHWAEGYIKHAQTMGIISGRNDKTFDPNAKVTGVEAALMCLRTAGYDAAKAGIGGATWANKTLSLANEAGLLDDVKADLASACPRQYAAQLIYNMLDTEWVVWSNDINDFKAGKTTETTVFDPDTNTYMNLSSDETVAEKYMGLTKVPGYMTSIAKESGKDTYTVETTAGTYTKVEKDYSDLMGQLVKVMIKDGKTDKVYGIFAHEDSKVLATGSVGELDTVSGDAKKVELNDVEYKTNGTASSMAVYNFNAETSNETLGNVIKNKVANAANSVKLIDNNDDGKVDRVVIVPTTVAKVTYVGKTSVTAGNKSYKFDDCSIYEGIEKDDFAVIVKANFNAEDKDTLTKAETLTGKVSGTKSDKVLVDGTWYTLTGGAKMPEVGDEVEMVVVGNYAYDVDTTVGSSKDILLITANDKADNDLSNDWTVDARAYFPDGTNKKIVIDKLNTNDDGKAPTDVTNSVNKDALKNTLFTYSTDKDGNYELKAVGTKNLAGHDGYLNKSYSAANDTIDGKKIADDAVIFVVATDDIKVVTGKTVKDWATSTTATKVQALYSESNGMNYVQYAALVVSGTMPDADGDMLYGYLTADTYKTKVDDDTVTAFEMWTGSENVTMYEDSTSHVGIEAGLAVAYKMDGDRIDYKATLDAYAITGFDNKAEGDIELLKNGGAGASTAYTLDEDCVVIAMDDAEQKGAEGDVASVSTANKENGSWIPNAYVALNTEGKVAAIVYDVTGELDEVVTPGEIADEIENAALATEKISASTMKEICKDAFAGLDQEVVDTVTVNEPVKDSDNAYTIKLSGSYKKGDATEYKGFTGTGKTKDKGYIVPLQFVAPSADCTALENVGGNTDNDVKDQGGKAYFFMFVENGKSATMKLQWKTADGNYGDPFTVVIDGTNVEIK